VVYPVLTNGEMTPSHSGKTVSPGMEEMPSLNIPVQKLNELTLLWARNPFRGNFNHWQDSRKEFG